MILLTLIAKVTIIVAIGLGTLVSARKARATLRHAVCVVTIATALLLPLTLLLPEAVQHSPFEFSVGAVSQTVSTERAGFEILLWIWMAGTALVLLRFGAGVLYLIWKTRQSQSPRCLSAGLRLAAVNVPVVWGWLRPTILMPQRAAHWSETKWNLAVTHELAHISRGDLWTSGLAALAEALYWFHPLLWCLTRRMRQEQELACDERVLAAGVDRLAYAELLLESANRSQAGLFGCAISGGCMKKRLERVLSFEAVETRRNSWTAIGALVCCLVAGVVFAPAATDVYKIGGDVSAPKIIHKQEPQYTPAARRDKVQGVAVLQIVVTTKGRPESIKVVKSLRPDMDQQAIKAVSKWRFEPAKKNGRPVAVSANVEVNFRLL